MKACLAVLRWQVHLYVQIIKSCLCCHLKWFNKAEQVWWSVLQVVFPCVLCATFSLEKLALYMYTFSHQIQIINSCIHLLFVVRDRVNMDCYISTVSILLPLIRSNCIFKKIELSIQADIHLAMLGSGNARYFIHCIFCLILRFVLLFWIVFNTSAPYTTSENFSKMCYICRNNHILIQFLQIREYRNWTTYTWCSELQQLQGSLWLVLPLCDRMIIVQSFHICIILK